MAKREVIYRFIVDIALDPENPKPEFQEIQRRLTDGLRFFDNVSGVRVKYDRTISPSGDVRPLDAT